MVETTAPAWSDVSTLIVFGSEKPLHAVECYIRQQRRQRTASHGATAGELRPDRSIMDGLCPRRDYPMSTSSPTWA